MKNKVYGKKKKEKQRNTHTARIPGKAIIDKIEEMKGDTFSAIRALCPGDIVTVVDTQENYCRIIPTWEQFNRISTNSHDEFRTACGIGWLTGNIKLNKVRF